jgi:hypothetical protein
MYKKLQSGNSGAGLNAWHKSAIGKRQLAISICKLQMADCLLHIISLNLWS